MQPARIVGGKVAIAVEDVEDLDQDDATADEDGGMDTMSCPR
jgi:hypothetical protein